LQNFLKDSLNERGAIKLLYHKNHGYLASTENITFHEFFATLTTATQKMFDKSNFKGSPTIDILKCNITNKILIAIAHYKELLCCVPLIVVDLPWKCIRDDDKIWMENFENSLLGWSKNWNNTPSILLYSFTTKSKIMYICRGNLYAGRRDGLCIFKVRNCFTFLNAEIKLGNLSKEITIRNKDTDINPNWNRSIDIMNRIDTNKCSNSEQAKMDFIKLKRKHKKLQEKTFSVLSKHIKFC
jgi:hypothetical protein